MKYRLGLDVGVTSIGWGVVELDEEDKPIRIERLGSRIFSAGTTRSGASLAAERRVKRGARRNRDRYLLRRERLLKDLVLVGLLPKNEDERKALVSLNPLELRVAALNQKIPLYHIGRALFHLHQGRGFKSNRLDNTDEDEGSKIKEAIKAVEERLSKMKLRTYGEVLWQRLQTGKTTKMRVRQSPKEEVDLGELLYPSRELIEAEFFKIWTAQAKHYPEILSDANRAKIAGVMFRQRPLRAVLPGRCPFEPAEFRARKASPIFQEFRLLQDLVNIRILGLEQERPLTSGEIQRLFDHLCWAKSMRYGAAIKLLRLGSNAYFNLEGAFGKKELTGCPVNVVMKDLAGDYWVNLALGERETIINNLLNPETSEETLRSDAKRLNVDPNNLIGVTSKVKANGYANLSSKAIKKIQTHMLQVGSYAGAVVSAGYTPPATSFTALPYYGEVPSLKEYLGAPAPEGAAKVSYQDKIGRIGNPNVHIALNELRRVVNGVIRKYGMPHGISIELVRELKWSDKRLKEYAKTIKENETRNKDVDPRHRLKERLWEELPDDEKVCAYTGRSISRNILHTDEIETDHIVPKSHSYENGAYNLVLCYRSANRDKGDRTPIESQSLSKNWPEIMERLERFAGKHLSSTKLNDGHKAWRKKIQRFSARTDEEREGFLARNLTDTAYIARVAKKYLESLDGFKNRVHSSPGQITAILRKEWGVEDILQPILQKNPKAKAPQEGKNRDDLRHHAIDAVVIALLDRSLLLQLLRDKSRRVEGREVKKVSLPWDNFRADLATMVDKIQVSHKTDHSPQGALFEETAYGISKVVDAKGLPKLVKTVQFLNLTTAQAKEIVDIPLRCRVEALSKRLPHAEALVAYQAEHMARYRLPINSVRIYDGTDAVQIKDRQGQAYKALKPDGNFCLDIYGDSVEWITSYEASKTKKPGLIASIHNNDTVRYKGALYRVTSLLRSDDALRLLPLHIANAKGTSLQKSVSLLRKEGFSLVHVDELGRAWNRVHIS